MIRPIVCASRAVTRCGLVVALSAPLALSAQTTPPATSTTAPQGTTTPGAAPTAAATASAAPTISTPGAVNRVSWAADRRAFNVGDIITVLIDDYTISTAVKENLATDIRSRGLSANARLPELSKGAGIDTRNAADQTQRGQARRENRFQNEMSVRVVATGPNGLLQVRGTKIIDVDKQKQDIAFIGWVRAQDISVTNVVESSRVADAQITYVSPGNLGKPKQGIITKVLGAVWP